MSKAIVRIPTPLRTFTGGVDEVGVEGATVGEALRDLARQHDGVLDQVVDVDGRVRGFVNIFVGETNVNTISGLETPIESDAVISIVPAVAGGAP